MQGKGVRPEVVDWILQKAEFAGNAGVELTLKSDQEEPTVALKKAVATRRTARTVLVESHMRVSRTNPKVERAVGRWRALLRKLKMHLQSRIGRIAPQQHRLVPWLVDWSAEVILKDEVRRNGRTRYEDISGHRVRHKALGFGEHVHFMAARDDSERNKFDGEWQEGYFVGVISRSGEYLATKGGRSTSVRRPGAASRMSSTPRTSWTQRRRITRSTVRMARGPPQDQRQHQVEGETYSNKNLTRGSTSPGARRYEGAISTGMGIQQGAQHAPGCRQALVTYDHTTRDAGAAWRAP